MKIDRMFFEMSDERVHFKAVPEKYRTLAPSYAKDFVSLDPFAA